MKRPASLNASEGAAIVEVVVEVSVREFITSISDKAAESEHWIQASIVMSAF